MRMKDGSDVNVFLLGAACGTILGIVMLLTILAVAYLSSLI